MYKHLALLILSGVLITGCEKKAEAPAEAAPVAEAAAPAAEPAPAAETPAPAETPAATDYSVGIPECDNYIAKYKACIEKVPEESRAAYQQGLDQMVDSWKQVPEEGKAAMGQSCTTATENAKTAMQAMGCEW
jgi:hypothetical protein